MLAYLQGLHSACTSGRAPPCRYGSWGLVEWQDQDRRDSYKYQVRVCACAASSADRDMVCMCMRWARHQKVMPLSPDHPRHIHACGHLYLCAHAPNPQ